MTRQYIRLITGRDTRKSTGLIAKHYIRHITGQIMGEPQASARGG